MYKIEVKYWMSLKKAFIKRIRAIGQFSGESCLLHFGCIDAVNTAKNYLVESFFVVLQVNPMWLGIIEEVFQYVWSLADIRHAWSQG